MERKPDLAPDDAIIYRCLLRQQAFTDALVRALEPR